MLFPVYVAVRLWQATVRLEAEDAAALARLKDPRRLIGLAWHNRCGGRARGAVRTP